MGKSFAQQHRQLQTIERVQLPDGRVGYVLGAGHKPEVGRRHLYRVYDEIKWTNDIPIGHNQLGEYTAFELTPA